MKDNERKIESQYELKKRRKKQMMGIRNIRRKREERMKEGVKEGRRRLQEGTRRWQEKER